MLRWSPSTVLLQSSAAENQEVSNDNLPLNKGPQSPTSDAGIAQVIDPTYCGDLQKLLRTSAWVCHTRKSPALSESEVNQTQNVWIREIRSQVYRYELADLKTKMTSRIPLVRQMRLFLLDDNRELKINDVATPRRGVNIYDKKKLFKI